MSEPTLERQVKCLKREIAMRKNVYPQWVRSGRMDQEQADEEIAAMTAALHTLMKVESGELMPKIAHDEWCDWTCDCDASPRNPKSIVMHR
jgi:hypothetical protein